MVRARAIGLTLICAAALAAAAFGQSLQVPPPAPLPAPQLPSPAPQAAPPTPQAAPQPVTAAPANSDSINRANTELVVTLLRTTMVAVQQANFSGNYSVLRDIAAPDFQAKNSAADLARVFTTLRDLKLDLGAAVLLDPQIRRAELTPDKKLYVAGAMATKPAAVTFEMLFQPVAGVWRIYGISITPVQDLAAAPVPAALAPVKPVAQHARARPKRPASPVPKTMALPPQADVAPAAGTVQRQ